MTRPINALVLSFGVFAVITQSVHADQWEHWAMNDPSEIFQTEGEAADHMRSVQPLGEFFTERGGVSGMSAGVAIQDWYPRNREPYYMDEWLYDGAYASEQEAIDAIYVSAVASAAPCPIIQFDVTSTWETQTAFLYLPTRQWKEVTIQTTNGWWNPNTSEYECIGTIPPWGVPFRRDRQATCPDSTFFRPDYEQQACVYESVMSTGRRPLTCGPTEGNPCDVANGTKLIRETDYAGAGIEFTRIFNSQTNASWTHNFSDYLIPDGVTAIGLVSAGGYHEPFLYDGSQNVAFSGSGVEAQLVGDEWVVHHPSGNKDYFSTAGVLLRRENTAGQSTTVNRDSDGKIESIVGPFGHTLALEYTSWGAIERITDPDNEEIFYEYDGSERLTTVTYQDGSERHYHYEDGDFDLYVTGITDENSDRYATYTYDDIGRVVSSEHAGGYGAVELVYSTDSTTVTDAESNTTTYDFTTDENQVRKITGKTIGGQSQTYSYPTWWADYQRRPTEITDDRGTVTQYTYDADHKTTEVQAYGTAQERTLTFEYLDETSQRPTSVTSPSVYSGHIREVGTSYNGSDLPETIEISGYTPSGTAVSRSTNLDYNGDGQVIEIDGTRTDISDVTTLTYYECSTGAECGQLESVTNALGHVTTYDTYDAHGYLLQMTDPNDVVITYEYDLRGRTTSVTETPPSGPARVTTYTYDDAGQLETVEAPNGTVLTYDYDAAHNLLSITDNLGNKIEYGYDLNGNRTNEDIRDSSSALRKTIEYAYDARNRVESVDTAGSVTDLVFDALGNLTDETDPNTNDTEHDYDPLNRLAETLDALSGVTEYGYDVNDYLTLVEAPNGAITDYVYDDLGNLLSVTSPDTGTTTYTYDAAGNRLSQTDANGVTVEYFYDALNRLTDIEYPNSTLDVSLVYDQGTNQDGRLTTMTDGSGTTTFSYDVFGKLIEESKAIDGHTHVTAYSYDEADQLTSITYPSGRTVDYARNVLGQVTEVETTYAASTVTVADDIAYEPFGPLAELTFGNSLVMSRTFDQQYRLTDQTTGSIQDLAFTLDAAGNIDAIADAVNSSLSQEFTQDALHRIDFEEGDYGTKDYTYDGVGNRLTRVHDTGNISTQTLTYTTSSNRLATHTGNTVTLDAAGNTTADPTLNLSFSYDDHNRMAEAYVGAVLQASYVYNGQGQRVKKVEATGAERTIVYHYGLSGELIGETIYSDVGAKIGERDYIWLDSLPLAQSERTFSGSTVTSSQFVYLHADQLNTPRLATNGSGVVVWRWDSDAFGVGDADTDPDSDTNLVNVRLRFPGQYLDEETGLHYNYFRDYDSVTGRYCVFHACRATVSLDGGPAVHVCRAGVG